MASSSSSLASLYSILPLSLWKMFMLNMYHFLVKPSFPRVPTVLVEVLSGRVFRNKFSFALALHSVV